jgi:hypothetical protein
LDHENKNEYLIAVPYTPTHIPDGVPVGAGFLDFVIHYNIFPSI